MEKIKEGLEEILHRSAHLIAKNGYHGTSMRDLAQEVSRSLSGLYHYFKNKEELLYLINFYGFSSIKKTLCAMLEKIQSSEDRLYAFILNHINYFAAHKDEMRVIRGGTIGIEHEKSRTITRLKEDYNLMGQQIVADIYQEKAGQALSTQELTKKTLLLFGMMNWSFGWFSEDKHGDFDTLIDDIYSLFLNGVYSQDINIPNKENIRNLYLKHKNHLF